MFGGSQRTTSQLVMPGWMEGMPQQIADSIMPILNRQLMSPEERIAPFSETQQNYLDEMGAYGISGPGAQILQSVLGIGAGPGGQGFVNQAVDMGPAQNFGMDMNQIMRFADNPYMDSMVDAASRDVTRNLFENEIPGARLAQALSGNTDSSRGAIGEALLAGRAGDRIADIGASLRGDAYGRSMGIEANRAAQNAAMMDSFGNRLLGAGRTMGALNANQANILNMANAMGTGNLRFGMGAGAMETAYEQSLRDWAFNNYNQPYQDAAFASGIINPMAEQYGTQVNETRQGPNWGAMALTGAGAILGGPAGAALGSSLGNAFGGGGGGNDVSAGMVPVDTSGWGNWALTG